MSKKKTDFVDDGKVVANMDNVESPYRAPLKKDNRLRQYDVSKQEKRHLILAGYKAFLPVLLITLAGMGIAMVLIMLWLHII